MRERSISQVQTMQAAGLSIRAEAPGASSIALDVQVVPLSYRAGYNYDPLKATLRMFFVHLLIASVATTYAILARPTGIPDGLLRLVAMFVAGNSIFCAVCLSYRHFMLRTGQRGLLAWLTQPGEWWPVRLDDEDAATGIESAPPGTLRLTHEQPVTLQL